MPGHGHRVFIETTRTSTPPLAGTHPRSPRHIPYRRHSLSLEERPAFIFRDSLNTMEERESSLLRNNHILKTQLQEKEKRISAQKAKIDDLQHENHELRRSLESSSDAEARREKMRDLKKKNTRLESENDTLKTRVRELLRAVKEVADEPARRLKEEISMLNVQIGEWRRRYEDVDRRLKRLRENLDDHIEQNERLTTENEVLRRQLEVEERLRRRHGY